MVFNSLGQDRVLLTNYVYNNTRPASELLEKCSKLPDNKFAEIKQNITTPFYVDASSKEIAKAILTSRLLTAHSILTKSVPVMSCR